MTEMRCTRFYSSWIVGIYWSIIFQIHLLKMISKLGPECTHFVNAYNFRAWTCLVLERQTKWANLIVKSLNHMRTRVTYRILLSGNLVERPIDSRVWCRRTFTKSKVCPSRNMSSSVEGIDRPRVYIRAFTFNYGQQRTSRNC